MDINRSAHTTNRVPARRVFLYGLFVICACCFLFFLPAEAFASEDTQALYERFLEAYGLSPYEESARMVSDTPLAGFGVTGGLPKATESTFDTVRVLVGTAPRHTQVMITLLQQTEEADEPVETTDVHAFGWDDDEAEPYTEIETFVITVGSSGLFSKTIDLPLGRTYILITAIHADGDASYAVCVNRKAAEIQKELEESIAFPGLNPFAYK